MCHLLNLTFEDFHHILLFVLLMFNCLFLGIAYDINLCPYLWSKNTRWPWMLWGTGSVFVAICYYGFSDYVFLCQSSKRKTHTFAGKCNDSILWSLRWVRPTLPWLSWSPFSYYIITFLFTSLPYASNLRSHEKTNYVRQLFSFYYIWLSLCAMSLCFSLSQIKTIIVVSWLRFCNVHLLSIKCSSFCVFRQC